jgi:hypothetical protein
MRPMIAQLYGHWISLKFSTIVDLCIFYSKASQQTPLSSRNNIIDS